MKENNNGNDTNVGNMENNIQEDIKLLQDKENCLGSFFKVKGMEEYKIALEHILSDYKRLQEEFKAVDSECSRLEHKEVELERIIELMSEHIFFNQSDKFPIAYSIKDVKDYFINIAKEVK